jgi:tRNA threonylcarbamoyl adenosine modification protein YeaZ
MHILAIDTSLGAAAAGLFDSDTRTEIAAESMAMERGHAEALVPLIGRVLARAEPAGLDLKRVVVTVGPGSFTGLRIGIAAARGFALARGVPVVGVSTLSAYAAPFIAANDSSIVAVAIDARHGEIYFQVFAPGGRTMVSPRALSLREAARAIGSGPVRLVGSGAPLLALEAWSLGVGAVVADTQAAPDIAWVARLGAAAQPEEALPRPLYIKKANATPQEAAALPRR